MTTVPSTPTPAEQERAEQLAADLERLASFIRENPDVAERFLGERFGICVSFEDNPPAVMADIARRARRAGASMTKTVNDAYAAADLHFGVICLHVFVQRDQVCTRVVTGTHEEIVEEPDPTAVAALPKVKKTVVVEDVTWECGPLLAAESGAVG